ncbi:DNA-binding IclR family transcriptional regulator [Neobacillus sp. B4I6]|jgi:DNA-binding IclR family transcriptional regulator|uniref:IclR family transcriptional regulator n=1 Tax=Neobacillus sp. B4I6 TaxID=3373925 RepID=UPI003D1E123B
MERNENSTFRSMHRIFEILEVLSKHPNGLTMMKIMDELDKAPKSSVYTLLQQMLKKRYVTYLENEKKYKIGPALIKLGAVIMSDHTIQTLARTSMEKLSKLTGEDIYLGVLEGGRMLIIDKVEGGQSLRLNLSVGTYLSIHSNAIGRIILAYRNPSEQKEIIQQTGLPAMTKNTVTDNDTFLRELERIRQEELAIDYEESVEGVMGIAAPVKNHLGEVVAGICISAPVSRVTPKKDVLIELLKNISAEISAQLGFENKYNQSF